MPLEAPARAWPGPLFCAAPPVLAPLTATPSPAIAAPPLLAPEIELATPPLVAAAPFIPAWALLAPSCDIVIGAFIVGNLAVIAVHIPDLDGGGAADVVQVDLAVLGDALVHGANAAINGRPLSMALARRTWALPVSVRRRSADSGEAAVIGVGVVMAELQGRVGHDDVDIVFATLGQAVVLGRSAVIFDILRPAVARGHAVAIVVNDAVRAAMALVILATWRWDWCWPRCLGAVADLTLPSVGRRCRCRWHHDPQ